MLNIECKAFTAEDAEHAEKSSGGVTAEHAEHAEKAFNRKPE